VLPYEIAGTCGKFFEAAIVLSGIINTAYFTVSARRARRIRIAESDLNDPTDRNGSE
jgi:hypothetical protein